LRDILTVIAGLVILVLAAALVVPPLIEWEAYRGTIDRAIAQATGTAAHTNGRIEVRLLPSPRVRFDAIRIGGATPQEATLDARFVKAELALSPLLTGDVRFTQARIGRAEIRVPTGRTGDWRVPADLLNWTKRPWAFDDVAVAQLFLTTQGPATGRTDQIYLETVRLQGQSLAGPWRVEGLAGTVPFRLATGELAADRSIVLKLSGGGDLHPRFDIDGRLTLAEGLNGTFIPDLTGNARLVFGPPAQAATAGLPLPVSVQSPFRTDGRSVELEQVTVEAGEGGASLRLTGSARADFEAPRIAVKLEGRRLDLDSFFLSPVGQAIAERARTWSPPPGSVPVDLDLSLASLLVAQEELANLSLRASFDKGRVRLGALEIAAPGQTQIVLSGEAGLTTEGGASGRIAITSANSDRLGRFVGKIGLGFLGGVLDGRAVEASADLALANPVASLRNLRLKLGDLIVTGNLRYTAGEAGARPRVDAQIGAQGLDLAQLPTLTGLFDSARSVDLGLALDARGVRQGAQPGVGRIAARIVSDGPALRVDTLEIADLAGANARVSGQIAPDGSGRITGRLVAKRAAPLVDLLGAVWVGGVAKLTPYFLREGDLDLQVTAERAAQQGESGLRLATTARGTWAGGPFSAEAVTAGGLTQTLSVELSTQNTGRWVDRPDAPPLRRPSSLSLKGVRVQAGPLSVTATGEIGGVKVATTRPFSLATGDDVVDAGEATLSADDVTPFLVLLGDGAGVSPPVPLQLRVTLGRDRNQSRFAVSGRVAGEGVEASVIAGSRSDVTGTLAVDRLSLPWLANALALGTPFDPKAASVWSPARFGQTRRLLEGGQVEVTARRLDLGRGERGEGAKLLLVLTPEGVALRDVDMRIAGGRLTGQVTAARQGSLGSVVGELALRDAALPDLIGASPFAGKLTGRLRFGGSGESPAALIANLAGSGDLRFQDLVVPNADAGAVDRGLRRVLAEADPLAVGRLQAVLADELKKGQLRVAAASATATLVGGVLRVSPLGLEAEAGVWQGAATLDWKTMAFDARGTLSARARPAAWTGSAPFIVLGLRGPLSAPALEIDVGPLTNGVAAIVLQRELEKVEAFEADANERNRVTQRRDMERARRLAAEESARRAAAEDAARKAADEAARRAAEDQAREARRLEQQAAEDAARRAREQADAERDRAREAAGPQGGDTLPALPPPVQIGPAPAVQPSTGG
jgi:hypothetical protein